MRKRLLKLAGGLAAMLVLAGVVSAPAQNLGELARQQRAKKQPSAGADCLAPRVLTEDDLKRERILTPEEKACLEAARQKPAEGVEVAVALAEELPLVARPPTLPLEEFAQHGRAVAELQRGARAAEVSVDVAALPAELVPPPPSAPLGDVARYYRALRDRRGELPAELLPTESAALPAALSPPSPHRDTPLGHIARYYRALAAARAAAPREEIALESTLLPATLAPPAPGAPLGDVAHYYRTLRELQAARREQTPLATETAALPAALTPPPASAPLGDTARFYRAQAALRQAPAAAGRADIVTESAALPAQLAQPPAEGAPLGDVARYYILLRQQREAREGAPRIEPAPVLATPVFSRPVREERPAPAIEAAPDVAPTPAAPAVREAPAMVSPARVAPGPEPESAPIPARLEKTLLPVSRTSAAPSSAAPPLSIRIEPGDTLWALAARHLGSGVRWKAIAAANPHISNPHFIRAGEMLRLPVAPADSDWADSPAADAELILIQPGDSLWRLAEQHYGSGTEWPCIARANPQITNPDLIFAGQTLALPASCSAR